MRKRVVSLLALMIMFMFIILPVNAQTPTGLEFNHVISNSEDWRDVYSVIHYANLQKIGSDFLVSTTHSNLLIPGLNRNLDIRVMSSEDRAFVVNYDNILLDNDFEDADEILYESANLELIEDLPDISNFIIVGNTYGYSQIAVAPYAVLSESWVFFADRINIDEIDEILSSRDIDNVLIYGYVEREVTDTLEKYDPEIINEGDRFRDNIAIVEKYMEIRPVDQVVLSNGEFIEKEIMSGIEPVLFTGKENVPPQIRDYIQGSDIKVGVLVGADLVNTATNIRRTTGISVIVKFARGARAPAGAISAVEGLDQFYLAVPIVNLELRNIQYNIANSQLEVTYRSNSNIPIYFRGTINPQDEDGELPPVGDVDPVFIAPNDFKTVSYSGIDFAGDSLTVDLDTLYGESPTGLDKLISATIEVDIINVLDDCDILINKVAYNKPKDIFKISVSNLAEQDCWVDMELHDVFVNNDLVILGSEGATLIKKGKKKNVVITAELTDEDLSENELIDVIGFYGEREESLVKIIQGTFELEIESLSLVMIIIIILVILIILIALTILILFLYKRRKEKADEW